MLMQAIKPTSHTLLRPSEAVHAERTTPYAPSFINTPA
jgi:hypothetical protein